jgi:primase-polymerase (primpol)-like protein
MKHLTLQTTRLPGRKNSYLLHTDIHHNTRTLAQLKMEPEQFWDEITEWLYQDFGITIHWVDDTTDSSRTLSG